MYLLDTDICIYAIKNRPKIVREKILSLVPGSVAISIITLGELIFGVYRSNQVEQNLKALKKWMLDFKVIDFQVSDAEAYGKIRFELTKQGKLIGPNDLLIASQALSRKWTLVTNNKREFRRVSGLHIQNWI